LKAPNQGRDCRGGLSPQPNLLLVSGGYHRNGSGAIFRGMAFPDGLYRARYCRVNMLRLLVTKNETSPDTSQTGSETSPGLVPGFTDSGGPRGII